MEAGLQLAALRSGDAAASDQGGPGQVWSHGTVAAQVLEMSSPWWRPLSLLEREHLASRAGEPYRDPGGQAESSVILAQRQRAQALSGAEPASAWRRRWGLQGGDR